MSCEAYDGVATTIHSRYGLQTCELPATLLVERALKRNDIVDLIGKMDILIWDEVSMSSKRILELINLLHHKVLKNALPFGGVQMILVGDFWQLKPIPNLLDKGIPVYQSKLFDEAFPHRVELTEVKRQHNSEVKLKNALDQVRMGECDDATEAYFQSLDRDIEPRDGNDVVHIYFKKLPVDIHNVDALSTLPGNFIMLESTDTGCAQYLEYSTSRVLTLKKGCNIMFLRNGSRGKFVGFENKEPDNQRLLVSFPTTGTVAIERRTWYRYNKHGTIEASRTQFPLAPFYAITAHKAQNLKMEAAVVHCSQEFMSGQTYVALSRVREEAALQVIGFRRKFLLPVPAELLSSCISTREGDPTAGCCSNHSIDDSFFQCNDENDSSDEEPDDIENQFTDESDSPGDAIFESRDGVAVNMEDVLLCLMCDFESKLSTLPPSFSIKDFCQKITRDDHTDLFRKSIHLAAKYATDNLDAFELLARILWCRIYQLFRNYLSENETEVHMTNRDFTSTTAKLHELFLTQDYRNDLISTFGVSRWSDIDDGQRTLGFELVFTLLKIFAAELGSLVKSKRTNLFSSE